MTTTPEMSELPVLQEFLENFPFDVAPRSNEDLSSEMKERLKALSAGMLAGEDLEGLSRDVLSNPDALDFLAELAKQNQQQSASDSAG